MALSSGQPPAASPKQRVARHGGGRTSDLVRCYGVLGVGHERELDQEVEVSGPRSVGELGSVPGIRVLDHRAVLDLPAQGSLPADANEPRRALSAVVLMQNAALVARHFRRQRDAAPVL